MESEGSLCSQKPATGPHPDANESVHPFSPSSLKIRSYIILPYTSRTSQWSLRFKFILSKFCAHFSSLPFLLHAPSISSSLTWSPQYLMKSTSYKAPYADFSGLLPLPPSYVQIFSSAPCSHTSPISVLPLVWETDFLGLDERIILKWIFMKQNMRMVFLDHLSDHQFLREVRNVYWCVWKIYWW